MPAVFTATTAAGGTEVWVTNGLPGGTHLLKDIYPGATSAIPQFDRHLTAINGQALFSATNPATGTEVWVTDGTTAGTHILRYFNPGAGDGGATDIVTLGGKGVFFSYDGTAPTLWTTDGTTGGTHAAGGGLCRRALSPLWPMRLCWAGRSCFRGFRAPAMNFGRPIAPSAAPIWCATSTQGSMQRGRWARHPRA